MSSFFVMFIFLCLIGIIVSPQGDVGLRGIISFLCIGAFLLYIMLWVNSKIYLEESRLFESSLVYKREIKYSEIKEISYKRNYFIRPYFFLGQYLSIRTEKKKCLVFKINGYEEKDKLLDILEKKTGKKIKNR
jgi:hypothetical protein